MSFEGKSLVESGLNNKLATGPTDERSERVGRRGPPKVSDGRERTAGGKAERSAAARRMAENNRGLKTHREKRDRDSFFNL